MGYLDLNVNCINCGLSNHKTTSYMPEVNDSSANMSDDISENETVEIRTVAGDQFIEENDIPLPTIIKIDVEGHEKQVLEGLKGTINRESCRIIYCEVHSQVDQEEIEDILQKRGYDISFVEVRNKDLLKGKKVDV